jgi:hypothetical protein
VIVDFFNSPFDKKAIYWVLNYMAYGTRDCKKQRSINSQVRQRIQKYGAHFQLIAAKKNEKHLLMDLIGIV